jgi:hypothetical protein
MSFLLGGFVEVRERTAPPYDEVEGILDSVRAKMYAQLHVP